MYNVRIRLAVETPDRSVKRATKQGSSKRCVNDWHKLAHAFYVFSTWEALINVGKKFE